jgi:hypothetical protein
MKLNTMAASSRLMITKAERRFPVRVRVGVPSAGFGERLNRLHAWLDDNCGADGWEITPAGMRSVINDAVAVYFRDAAMAAAFAARWCAPVARGEPDGFLYASEMMSPLGASLRGRIRRRSDHGPAHAG